MRAITTALTLLVSLAIVNGLRAADAAEGQESKHPPRLQNFGLPLDQLNLTDAQKAKLDELWKEYGPQMAESEKKMAAILTDEQRQARQEAGQAARASGKTPKEMRDAMESATNATGEQKARIAELRQEMAPLQQEIREKILALLTPEQNEKLRMNEQIAPATRAPAAAASAAVAGVPAGRTTLEFPRGTGHRWMVNGPGGVDQRRGPGNNYWSNAPDMVWVDEKGLHLKIVKRGDQWRCSAVGLPEGLGYGKYIFSLATRVDRLDRNVVIGLFTFNNETFKTDAHGELDVEITSWGKETPHPQIDYTVQPARGGHLERGHRVDPTSAERTTHVIEWTPRYVEFHSYEGDGETGQEIGHFRFDDTNPASRLRNPVTGEESDPVVIPNPHNKSHAAINLWLVKGQPPANAADIEIVVSNFRFVPRPE